MKRVYVLPREYPNSALSLLIKKFHALRITSVPPFVYKLSRIVNILPLLLRKIFYTFFYFPSMRLFRNYMFIEVLEE